MRHDFFVFKGPLMELKKENMHYRFKTGMARANLNKSKFFLTFTTTASNYIPKRPRICIN